MNPFRGTDRAQGCARTPQPALSAEDERFLADLAGRVRDAGLASAAVLWLESLRPLSFLGGQVLHAAAPLLDLLLPDDEASRLARLLERRENLDVLLARLEAGDGAVARRAASS